MYLVRTKNGDNVVSTANGVKEFNKNEIEKIYSLSEVDYDSVVSTSDIRDCIYKCLKGSQQSKDDVLNSVTEILGIKKNEVSKVITEMKREKIIYVVKDFGWLGID